MEDHCCDRLDDTPQQANGLTWRGSGRSPRILVDPGPPRDRVWIHAAHDTSDTCKRDKLLMMRDSQKPTQKLQTLLSWILGRLLTRASVECARCTTRSNRTVTKKGERAPFKPAGFNSVVTQLAEPATLGCK